MNSQNLLKGTCSTHPDNQIIIVCLNQYCQLNKLLCTDCIIDHTEHANSLVHQNQLEENLNQAQLDCQKLINKLNENFDQLIKYFTKLKQSIQLKYGITTSRVKEMDNNQLNQYFKSLLSYPDQNTSLTKIIEEACNAFNDKLDTCLNILGLQQLDYIDLSLQEKQRVEQFYQQGFQYLLKSDYVAAIKLFDQVLDINNHHLKSLHYKGEALRMMNKYQKSLEQIDKALELDHKCKPALLNKSLNLKSLGEFDESFVWIEKVLEIDPKNKNALKTKGQLLTKLKRDQEALDCFNLNLQINSNDSQILGELGACLIKLGKLDEAEVCFNQAIKMDPNNQQMQYAYQKDLQKQIIN